MKTSEDYRRYETAARGMALAAETDSERAYFTARAELHATRAMDTADRYPLSMARDLLARQMGRKTAARMLFDARFGGPVTIGGTRVEWRGNGFTITDA